MGKRRMAREMAVQMLYQSEMGGSSAPQVMAGFDRADYLSAAQGEYLDRRRAVDEAFDYARGLLSGTLEHREEIDGLIRSQADNWRLERMPAVDRNILRLAVYEILYQQETPDLVVVDEAIELAKKFGSEQSGRFINGLLDGLLRSRAQEGDGETLRIKKQKAPARVVNGILLGTLAGAAIAAGGCGYSLVGRASNLPADVREIFIRPLENQTPRSQVEQSLTSAIADELVTRQRFAVVQAEGDADAVLSGAVTAFTVTPVTFDDQGRATEYEITVVARMSFRRGGPEGAVLWSNERYVFRENYQVEVSETGYFDQEDAAIEEVAERFAETMVSDLLEGF